MKKLFASILIFCLAFGPSPAYALRGQDIKERPDELSGLEEILKDPTAAINRLNEFVSSASTSSAAGLEEGWLEVPGQANDVIEEKMGQARAGLESRDKIRREFRRLMDRFPQLTRRSIALATETWLKQPRPAPEEGLIGFALAAEGIQTFWLDLAEFARKQPENLPGDYGISSEEAAELRERVDSLVARVGDYADSLHRIFPQLRFSEENWPALVSAVSTVLQARGFMLAIQNADVESLLADVQLGEGESEEGPKAAMPWFSKMEIEVVIPESGAPSDRVFELLSQQPLRQPVQASYDPGSNKLSFFLQKLPPAAGLEETDSEEKNILNAVPALLSTIPTVQKSTEIDQERTRRIARSLRDFFRGHRSILKMPRGVSDLLIARRPQGESGPSDYVAVWLFQAVASYLDDPDPQVRADMQETLAPLVKIVKLQLAVPRSKMQEGIERTLENLKGSTQEPEVRVAAYRAFWAFLEYDLPPSPLQILEVSESAMLDLQDKNSRVREAAVNTVYMLLFETIMSRGDGVRRVEMEEVEKFIPLLKSLQDDPDDGVRKSVNETLRSFDNVRELRRKAMIDQWSELVASAEGFSGSTSADHLIRTRLLVHGATTSLPSATASQSANLPTVVSPTPQVSLSPDASEDQLVIESNSFSDLEGQLRIVETKGQLTISRPSGEPLRIQSGIAPHIRGMRYDPNSTKLTLYLDPSTGVKAQKIGRLAVRESSDGPDYLLTLWIDIAASTAAGLEEQEKKFSRLRKQLVNEQGRARIIEEGPMEGYVRLIPDSLITRQIGLLPRAVLNFLSLSPERAILRNLIEFRVGGAFYTQAVIGGPVVDNVERPITVLLVLAVC